MNGPAFDVAEYVVTLAAGATREINAQEYVALVASTGELSIAADGRSFAPLGIRRGFRARPGEHMGKVIIKNRTVASITATIITGIGDYADFQAYTSAAPIAASIVSPNPLPVSLPAGAQAVHGDAADGAALATNSVPAAGKASDGKVRTIAADVDGRQLAAAAIPSNAVRGSHLFAAPGVVDIIAAPGAGIAVCATAIVVANDGLVDDIAIILDDATEIFRVAVKAGDSKLLNLPAPGIVIQTNKALRGDIVVGGGGVRIFSAGYKATP